MNKISIRGLEISATHGVHAFEKTTAQPFIFDADLHYPFSKAVKSDDVKDAVSYSDVCAEISRVALGKSYNLIETLAYDTACALLQKFPAVYEVTLCVGKPQAPVRAKFDTVSATVTLRRERAFLSLGSSLGDRKGYLDKAVSILGGTRGITVEKVSSCYETAPYGGVAVNNFLNCAVQISTFLSPEELLAEIHAAEELCGRVRTVRWGDRTLDIDIILYGNLSLNTPELTVPHPDYLNREFVLKPLEEIAPYLSCFKLTK